MADKDKFFQITTMPRRNGISGKLTKIYRKRQLVISVIGAYVLIGGLLGFILFNSAGDRAQASDDIARVTPIIDLVDTNSDQLVIGDAVEVKLTLQNRSSTEAVNNLTVEFFSTKNSVNWSEISLINEDEGSGVVGQDNTFKLPVLSAGERATYTAKGVLQNEDSEFLTILAKVRFLNAEGQQEVHSNRVFTEINGQRTNTEDLVTLAPSKESFLPGEEVGLSLDANESFEIDAEFALEGKVYVSQYNSQQLTDSIDCIFGLEGVCNVTTSIQTPGQYSALFVSNDQAVFSQIAQFRVMGASSETNINPQVSVEYPFGSQSINGIVPVYANRVISLNNAVSSDDICTFEILQNNALITEVTVPVRPDRTCISFINATQIPTGDGVYGIRLRGDDAIKEVSVVRKSTNLIDLQSATATQSVGNPLSILSGAINDISGAPVNGDSVTLGILHRDSGNYQELSVIGGEQLTVNNGQFATAVPASVFEQGGLYLVYFVTENGVSSDFLSIDYGGGEIGLVYSGVIVDNYENLQVGKNLTFSLENITDRSGNAIADGSCQAGIYTKSSNATPLILNGAIESGNCNVFVESGTITEAGPILVSYAAPEISSDISQSRHFNINPGLPASFGQLNMEYEPIRKNYANNAIIGPVVDQFGNITDAYGLSIEVISENVVLKTINDINTEDGFAKITLPSSAFQNDSVIVRVSNSLDQELLVREFVLVEDESKLILPVLQDTVNNDETIDVSVPNLILSEEETCNVSTILTTGEVVTADAFYSLEDQLCRIEWDLNQNRSNSKMLLNINAGSKKYSNIVTLTNGEAANLFSLTPSTRIDSKDEAHVSLLSSIITDKFGLQVQDGEVRVQYNGKSKVVDIENGTSSISITGNELSSKDIREVFDNRYLDLNLDASASVVSINTSNYLSIFLGEKSIALADNSFNILKAQSHIAFNASKMLAFKSEICRAVIVNEDTTTAQLLKTHKQGDTCYVQVEDVLVPSTILFEERGYVVGEFDLTPVYQTHDARWCSSANCIIQVVAPLNSIIEANVYDGDNVYNFKGGELENVVRINQNGLNPTNEYLVEIKFTNNNNQRVTFYNTILGEYLIGESN